MLPTRHRPGGPDGEDGPDRQDDQRDQRGQDDHGSQDSQRTQNSADTRRSQVVPGKRHESDATGSDRDATSPDQDATTRKQDATTRHQDEPSRPQPGRPTARTTRPRGRRSTQGIRRTQPKVVALGGGMGLSASLAALRRITGDLTAVVTVADDGGSSGRLRSELGVLPPGDLRKALAALCGDDDWGQTWARVIQHRFQSGGEMHGHAVGNLLIVALWEQLGDHVQALDLVGKLLGAHGRVLPMSAVPLELQALVRGHDPVHPDAVHTVRGQSTVALTPGEVQSVHLMPHDPPAVPAAVRAVLDADWVVLGPGSWFTSVIPHLLVPELAQALAKTKARRVLSLNLAPQPGETEGFSPQRHLEVLGRHAPKLALDVVLADKAAVPDSDSLTEAARGFGAAVELAFVARPDGSPRHDPELLAAAYDRIFRMHGRIGPWR